MKVETYCAGNYDANCYIITNEQNGAMIIIDPSSNDDALKKIANENDSKIKLILITHRHFDHILGASMFSKATGAPIAISVKDACGLGSSEDSLLVFVGVTDTQEYIIPEILLKDKQIINYAGFEINCISTPGHTVGGMSFIIQNALFTGDTLFKKTIGRTDLPTSSDKDMRNSLNKLRKLAFDYKIYPGHGESSSLFYELKNNPYFN